MFSQNISTEANLEKCPFCGADGEIHVRQGNQTFYASESEIPVGAIVYGKTDNGLIISREMVYVPRCSYSKCIARSAKSFSTIEEATKVWNFRNCENVLIKTTDQGLQDIDKHMLDRLLVDKTLKVVVDNDSVWVDEIDCDGESISIHSFAEYGSDFTIALLNSLGIQAEPC